jgi:hypothetical protein
MTFRVDQRRYGGWWKSRYIRSVEQTKIHTASPIRVMSRINHERPILQLIDDLKKRRREKAGPPSLIFDRSRAHRPGAAIPYWKLAKSTSPRRPFDFADDLTVFLRRSKKKIEAGAAEMALLIKIERLLDEWSRRF